MGKMVNVCKFKELMGEVFNERFLDTLIDEHLEGMGFFVAPASTKYHGNYPALGTYC